MTYISSDILLFPPRIDKPLVWMEGEIKSPPFTAGARLEAGMLLRRLQEGKVLRLPHSRPMPDIGPRCHELRIRDETKNWRIFYHLASDAVVILGVVHKSTQKTPPGVVAKCRRQLKLYQSIP